MAFVSIPVRAALTSSMFADINQLSDNCDYCKTEIEANDVEIAAIQASMGVGGLAIVAGDSPYTILDASIYAKYICDTTAGAIVINLPTLADNLGENFSIIHAVQVGTNTVTINREGADVITADGLTSIILPKAGDYIEYYGSAQSAKWELLSERITAMLRLDDYAGFGTADTRIIQFTNSRTNIGTGAATVGMFQENHSSGYNAGGEGLEITINRSGKYSFSFTNYTASLAGLSLNSAQLGTTCDLINSADQLAGIIPNAAGGVDYANAAWTGPLDKDDVVRAHSNAVAPGVGTTFTTFTAVYLGQ